MSVTLAAQILILSIVALNLFSLGAQCVIVGFDVEVDPVNPRARLVASFLGLPLRLLILWLAWKGLGA